MSGSCETASRFFCPGGGNSFVDPFGNHSRFQVVTRIGAARTGPAQARNTTTRLRMVPRNVRKIPFPSGGDPEANDSGSQPTLLGGSRLVTDRINESVFQ